MFHNVPQRVRLVLTKALRTSVVFGFIGFLGLSACSEPACAQSFSTPVRLRTGSGLTDHAPSLGVGRDGTVYVSWFSGAADIWFARSNDSGRSFTAPREVAAGVTKNIYTSLLQRRPQFAIDTKGTIHMVWTEDRVGGQTDIWYVRSTDHGDTWSAPRSILDPGDSGKYAQDFPSIAIDSADNLYVSYLDNRYLEQGLSAHYHLHLQKSTDGGASWSRPILADKLTGQSWGTCECCSQQIAVSPEGHIYIAFRSNISTGSTPDADSGIRDIWIARSMDGGWTFEPSIQAQLGDWLLNACPTTGPDITLDAAENLHLVWRDSRQDSSGRSVAYYGLLPKGQAQVRWNQALSRSRTQSANWPTVAVVGSSLPGRRSSDPAVLAAAYMLTDHTIHVTFSSDAGNSWTRDVAIPAGAGDQQLPLLRSLGNRLYAVWQDGNSSSSEIYFSALSSLPQPESLAVITPIVSAFYQPGELVKLKWTSPQNLTSKPFLWYDVTLSGGANNYRYAQRTQDTAMIFDSLATGIYGYRIVAHTAFDSSETSGDFAVASMGVDANGAAGVRIFPNPVRRGATTLNILLTGFTPEPVSVKLFDLRGNVIDLTNIKRTGDQLVVDAKEVAPGIYYCEISNPHAVWRAPLVVE